MAKTGATFGPKFLLLLALSICISMKLVSSASVPVSDSVAEDGKGEGVNEEDGVSFEGLELIDKQFMACLRTTAQVTFVHRSASRRARIITNFPMGTDMVADAQGTVSREKWFHINFPLRGYVLASFVKDLGCS